MKQILVALCCVVLFFGVIAGLDYSGLMWESFIGPKRENVRRNIFEQTKSYNQGMQQDLIRFMHEYRTAKTLEEKQAIAATVRHMMADYDESKVTLELRGFLSECKYK